MPLSPAEAKAKQIQNASETLRQVEQKIDAALTQGTRKVAFSGVAQFIREEIKRRYERVGWHVRLEHDRDGGYWDFSETPHRSYGMSYRD